MASCMSCPGSASTGFGELSLLLTSSMLALRHFNTTRDRVLMDAMWQANIDDHAVAAMPEATIHMLWC